MMRPWALGGAEPVDGSAFQPIWDRWNAMSPDEQAAAGLMTDAQYIQMLDQLSDEDLASISFPFLGLTLDAVGLIRLRLREPAPHTRDVAVTLPPVAARSPRPGRLALANAPRFPAPPRGDT